MVPIFCSRIKFTLLGAPIDAFFLESIQSASFKTLTGLVPYAPLNTQPNPQSFMQSYAHVQLAIAAYVTRDSKSFDFGALPYDLVNIQLALYKEDELIGLATGVHSGGQDFIAPDKNRAAIMALTFHATSFKFNMFV